MNHPNTTHHTAVKVGKGGGRIFMLMWLGQLLSWIGTHLTGFGLGVTIFEQSGATTHYALISFATIMPETLLSPVAGTLADRFDRKLMMILGHAGAGICSLGMIFLVGENMLSFGPALLLVTISSCFNALIPPAFGASIPLLVQPENLARASGFQHLGFSLTQLISPMLAGILLTRFGLTSILTVDVLSFASAILILSVLKIPKPPIKERGENEQEKKPSFWAETVAGWTCVKQRPGLIGFLIIFGITNFNIGMISILITPMILGFSNAEVLGRVISFGGIGMLAGSLLMIGWGGPKRQVYGVLFFSLIQSMVFFLAAVTPSVYLIAAGAFLALFCSPLISSCGQAIWQRKIPPDFQGRVFAIRNVVGGGTFPLAFVLAGPLADYIFEPLMQPDGPLADSLGIIIGTGPGRGTALMFIVLGMFGIVSVLVCFANHAIRRVDLDLPDFYSSKGDDSGDHASDVAAQT